ncbi:hypothetical protein SISSUDRAFT_1045425 [Sistotremastrum suecicum HHB10207 ss-3]|uniref:F-box domain-containing protein n=1 Tax=Sistotremastrum suecicum HHB10207 ss-3 TaxID=1314776 RepID=A0A166EG16_9AGAM|nr:hypothetical protein SISSUDRAFT_1045425 [Sistotremastrum suecicum HHB10207 ss-3]
MITSITPNLDSLAVELVVEILKGVDIRTISSVALTSSRFYHIAKNERKLWTDACDILDLPLQTGETVATTPTHSFLSLAMRALLIQKRLQNSGSQPPSFRELNARVSNSSQRLLPGGQWMLFRENSSLYLLNIKDGTMNSSCEPILVAPTNLMIATYAFETLGNREMRLAVGLAQATESDSGQHQVAIIHLHFPLQQSPDSVRAEERPQVMSLKFYALPAFPRSISLSMPLVLILSTSPYDDDNNFHGLIFDCEIGAGLRLKARPPAAEVEARMGTKWYWLDLCIHPTLRKLVLPCIIDPHGIATLERTVVLLADIPRLSNPLQVEPNATVPNILESIESLHFTHIHLEKHHSPANFPLPDRYVPITEYAAHNSRELVSLCLDTERGIAGAGELVALSVKEQGIPGSPSILCSKNLHDNPLGFRLISDHQTVATYIDHAHTMVSSLKIPFPPELMQDTLNSNYCSVLEVDTIQGLILLGVRAYVPIDGPLGHRMVSSTWLIRY